MTTFALIMIAVVVCLWIYKSIQVVPQNAVALLIFMGRAIPTSIYTTHFVPYIPIKFGNFRVWELRIYPKILYLFNYEGTPESPAKEHVWSSDHQQLFLEISGFVRFPYDESDSLVRMYEAGVPRDKEGLVKWIKEEVIAGSRNFMAQHSLHFAISRPNLEVISQQAQIFFVREEGLFAKSGICGQDSGNFTPGTGEVVLRIDSITPTQEVREAMGRPTVARYDAEAADSIAKARAKEAVGPVEEAMSAWVADLAAKQGKTVKEILPELRRSGEYERYQRLVVDRINREAGTVQEQKFDLLSGGNPMNTSSLNTIAIGSGGVGMFAGGRGGKNRGGGDRQDRASDRGSSRPGDVRGIENDTDADRTKAADAFFKANGVYPSWDPERRQPQEP
jgi:hypothetical protein